MILQAIVLAVLLLLAAAVPSFISAADVTTAQIFLTIAISAAGLRLIVHRTGTVLLGHAAFFVLGAYLAAIVDAGPSVPFLAGLVAFLAGAGLSLPLLALRPARLAGPYVAAMSLGLAVATPFLLRLPALEPWTNGAAGLVLTGPSASYYVTLAFSGLVLAATQLPLAATSSQPLSLFRDPVLSPQGSGSIMSVVMIGVGAGCAGIAGALYAQAIQFVAPDFVPTTALSLTLAFGLLAVGSGSLWSVAGASIVAFCLPLYQRQLLGFGLPLQLLLSFYGGLVVLCALLMPSGLAGFWQRRAPDSLVDHLIRQRE